LDTFRSNPLFSHPLVAASLRVAKKTMRLFVGQGKSIIESSNSFIMVEDIPQPQPSPFAKDLIPVDGHPMTSPAGSDWMICDSYPDDSGCRDLFLFRFSDELRIDLGRFRMLRAEPDMEMRDSFFSGVDKKVLQLITPASLAFTRSGLHCDLHPRWNSLGTRVLFDSIHEGSRQIYAIQVSDLINNID
jgi:hypothetical protein